MSTAIAGNRRPGCVSLLPFVAAVAVVAVMGGVAASSSSETYRALDLPSFAPPSWLFGPVWTVLYAMIAVAGWIAWRARSGALALSLWGVQLLLNLAWTPLFFAAGRYGWALVDIVALLAVIAATVVAFRRTAPLAAWLMVPYAAWVAFATALNAAIVVLN
ncbi:MAG TPA: TspO/MBR family protein [Nocardioides sp.]|nr:TspO/MBR family protein [Nocardioides sp.]